MDKAKTSGGLSLIAWVSLIGWFFFIPFVLVETPWDRYWSDNEWLLIGYLGILSTAFSYVFFAFSFCEKNHFH